MEKALSLETIQDRRISEAFEREQPRLWNHIRKRVADRGDAEDILQEVFYELVEAYRAMKPVEQVGAWLFRVARNRITDLFRKKKPEPLGGDSAPDEDKSNWKICFLARRRTGSGLRARCLLDGFGQRPTNCRKSSGMFSSRTRSRGAASRSSPRKPD